MINIKHEDTLKVLAQLQCDMIPGGSLFLFVEDRTIKWKVASKTFDMDVFKVGSDLAETAVAVRAIKENKVINEKVPREKYGQRLITTAVPLVDDSNTPVGVFSIIVPRLHPVAAGFNDFAPIVAEMFPEGAFLYMTDLTKVAYVQHSKKFQLPEMYAGREIKSSDIAYKTIKTGKEQIAELNKERFGVPVYIANFPLYDEDTGKNIVATLGVVTPKVAANQLKDMSENLSNNLSGISATVEQLAASASRIHENEQGLYNDIKTVTEILDKINVFAEFISTVANQSNMLGLNAAIESARAGDAGKGFGVVSDQIRKLSAQSKETVPQIKALIEDIKSKIDRVAKESQESLVASEEQAAATEEISASVEELSALTDQLNNLAKDL